MAKAIIVTDEVYDLLDRSGMIEADGNIEYKVDWNDIRPYLVGRLIGLVMMGYRLGIVIGNLEDSLEECHGVTEVT